MKRFLTVITVLMWMGFLGVLAAILYLSFQTGTSAKVVDQKLTMKVAGRVSNISVLSEEELADLIWKIRQYGRIIIFILLGFFGTTTIHLTFRNWNWLVRTIVSSSMLLAIAVFTEKYKDFLPTRHFSQEEMIFSIIGVIIGFGFVTLITCVFSIIKLIIEIISDLLKRNKTE